RSQPVESSDALAEGASTDATIELMLKAAAAGPVALSTHGDIIENVLDELTDRAVPLTGPVALEKGSTWIIDVADGSFAGARCVPPPAGPPAGATTSGRPPRPTTRTVSPGSAPAPQRACQISPSSRT